MDYDLRQHQGLECPDVSELEELAGAEGHSFVERTRKEWLAGINRFDRQGEGLFLAVAGGRTVGVCGLNSDPYVDDPAVGRLRHLYVHPDYRRLGMAGSLVDKCLSIARGSFDRVRLRTTNPAADRFYRSAGFEVVSETSATHELRL